MAAVCEITILYGFLFDNDKGLTLLGGGGGELWSCEAH